MKKIYGLYNDDTVLTHAAKAVVEKGVHVSDVYSPFPIHGIENVIGMKWTRLAICAFIYGLTGLVIALSGMWWFMGIDWPMIIGGKPNFAFYQNVPAFIPIAFEFTVLCAAHGMAITYFIRNWTFPGSAARNPDPRTTDAHFAMEIDPHFNSKFSKQEIVNMLAATAPVEIFEKNLGEEKVALKKGAVSTAKATKKTTVSKAVAIPPKKAKIVGKKDDLTKIEGIGPKIKSILHDNGILSFEDLASSTPAKVKKILAAQGKRYQMHDPKTWPKQAKLAADGKWDALKKLQDKLDGGK